MLIQWFPGHMAKALREMEKSVKKVDSIIYMLDARAPYSCINPLFSTLIQNKPTLYVINKADTVEADDSRRWIKFFSEQGKRVVLSNSVSGRFSSEILSALTEVNAEKIKRNQEKGISYSVKAMVIGMPNTGKSTLINSLAKDKKAITGNKPGVTKSEQWIRLANGMLLLDTPGTLCHSIENDRTALNLAFLGSIRDAVLDIEGLTLKLIEFLLSRYPGILAKRYSIIEGESGLEAFDSIAKARGYILKGKEVDYTRTANAVLDDFRKQRLGRLILEKPDEKD